MKKSMAISVVLLGLTAAAVPAMAAEQAYISWTFDDFDSNCEVIETTAVQPAEQPALHVENSDVAEAGELGG